MATRGTKNAARRAEHALKTVPGKAVSTSKVQAVAKACFHARASTSEPCTVEQFIKKAPAHCRLAGVYAIDAVSAEQTQLKDKDPFVARWQEIGVRYNASMRHLWKIGNDS